MARLGPSLSTLHAQIGERRPDIGERRLWVG